MAIESETILYFSHCLSIGILVYIGTLCSINHLQFVLCQLLCQQTAFFAFYFSVVTQHTHTHTHTHTLKPPHNGCLIGLFTNTIGLECEGECVCVYHVSSCFIVWWRWWWLISFSCSRQCHHITATEASPLPVDTIHTSFDIVFGTKWNCCFVLYVFLYTSIWLNCVHREQICFLWLHWTIFQNPLTVMFLVIFDSPPKFRQLSNICETIVHLPSLTFIVHFAITSLFRRLSGKCQQLVTSTCHVNDLVSSRSVALVTLVYHHKLWNQWQQVIVSMSREHLNLSNKPNIFGL